MIEREYIVKALSSLGEVIMAFLNGKENNPALEKAIDCSCNDNYWFTKENILRALDAIVNKMLDNKKLNDWVSRYPFDAYGIQNIGLIMAGNIPLVGFHDLLSVLLSGNVAVIKPSSKDKYLIKTLCGILSDKFPVLSERIVFTEVKPQNVNAVIATGSNNSARYFRAEYKDIPLLSRKNRYSLAVLDGNETNCELEALGDDIFSYFGLGCRNVSNIFVPKNYDWNMFFAAMEKYSDVIKHQGYNDCFRYQKALSDLAEENYLSNGFVIIRKNNPAFSSIASINYTTYKDIEQVKAFLVEQKEQIQCVVSKIACTENPTPFGYTQKPELTDYADGVNTMNFICPTGTYMSSQPSETDKRGTVSKELCHGRA
ncbi:MAG: hypothetical protein LBS55_12350 [Prevotellaceae bacterium]|jgi:hypothetical protein|nr:hypothetical protein [Prevotellaceae bacterium]